MCQKFCELRCWVTETFSWCPTFSLLEGVSSMSLEDRQEYSKVFGILPYEVDSKQISLCRRPRLWWFNWEITKKEGYLIYPPETSHSSDYGAIVLEAPILPSTFIKPGWKLTNPEGAFATFCTAQPSKTPRFKPSGPAKCTHRDLQAWKSDRHRFPPFQYNYSNGVIHKKHGWRMLTIEEKESIMGFPIGFTSQAWNKTQRSNRPQDFDDCRMSLLGNAWHVGVVAALCQPLLCAQGFVPSRTMQEVTNLLRPGNAPDLAGRLLRPTLEHPQPFAAVVSNRDDELELVRKLSHLVSAKGTDVMLTAETEVLPRAHRLRNSLTPKLWRWKTICGWRWRPTENLHPEHINKLEMRAIYTSLKWRLFHQRVPGQRVFHLVDSMVSLQLLNKGRTSSRKLRHVCKKISALLLAGNVLLILAYTSTKTNPADAPSRGHLKRKWSAVK